MPATKEHAAIAGSGVSITAVLAMAYELFFGMQADISALNTKVIELESIHAQRCEVDSKFFQAQAAVMTELAGLEKNTASRYVALAEATGSLSEVDRLRMEEKLRRQSEYEGRGAAYLEAANTVCQN